MRKINRQIVSALIISKDRKLLMGIKAPDKGGVYSDCWHIPGGGIEENEDKIEALKREVSEEVGTDISQANIKLIDDMGKGMSIKKLGSGEEVECYMQFNVYEVNLTKMSDEIEVKLNDDLVKYVWADIQRLGEYNLTPPSIELFKRLDWIK